MFILVPGWQLCRYASDIRIGILLQKVEVLPKPAFFFFFGSLVLIWRLGDVSDMRLAQPKVMSRRLDFRDETNGWGWRPSDRSCGALAVCQGFFLLASPKRHVWL